jgi:hypothetical protein
MALEYALQRPTRQGYTPVPKGKKMSDFARNYVMTLFFFIRVVQMRNVIVHYLLPAMSFITQNLERVPDHHQRQREHP